MRNMSNCGRKDDLDLTSDDIGALLDAGEPVEITPSELPQTAVLVTALHTFGGSTRVLVPPVGSLSSVSLSSVLRAKRQFV